MDPVIAPCVMPVAKDGAASDVVGDGGLGDVDGGGAAGDVTGDGDANDADRDGVACDVTGGGCERAVGDASGNGLVMPMAWMLLVM